MNTNKELQNRVMGFAQAIFVGLPFDRYATYEIVQAADLKHIIPHESNHFELFSEWIKSENCKNSRNLAILG